MRVLTSGALAAFVLTLTLTGCGQKGPLYFPEDEDDEQAGVEQILAMHVQSERAPVTRETIRHL